MHRKSVHQEREGINLQGYICCILRDFQVRMAVICKGTKCHLF